MQMHVRKNHLAKIFQFCQQNQLSQGKFRGLEFLHTVPGRLAINSFVELLRAYSFTILNCIKISFTFSYNLRTQ